MSDTWPFADPRNVAVFTTAHVLREGLIIDYISHDTDDGAWQFLNSATGADEDKVMIVGLGTMLSHDPSLADIAALPLGWIATRASVTDRWSMRLRPQD